MNDSNNEKEISVLLKESTELLFNWHLEYNKQRNHRPQQQDPKDILAKKDCISQKIEELGGDTNISEELFNKVKQELLNKRLEKIDREFIELIKYNRFGHGMLFT